MNKKYIYLSLVVVVAGIATMTASFKAKEREHVAEATAVLTDYQSRAAALNKQITGYILEGGFISEELTAELLSEAKADVEQLTEIETSEYFEKDDYLSFEELVIDSQDTLTELTFKYDNQTTLNAFYTEPVLVGAVVKTDGVVVLEAKDMAFTLESDYEDDWSKAMTDLFELAKDQITVNDQAESAVASLFSQDTVEESVTRDKYVDVEKQVSIVKNETLKKALQEKMKAVLAVIETNEDTARRAEAESEALAIGGSVEKQDDGSYIVIEPEVEEVYYEEEPIYELEEPTTSIASGGNSSSSAGYNNSDNTQVATPSQPVTPPSSGSATETPKSSENENSSNSEWKYVGKNPNTGGDVYISDGPPIADIEDLNNIPGVEIGNTPW